MCKSIDLKYQEVCEKEKNPRFCQYCQGTSGLSRDKEVKLLELRLKQESNIVNTPNILEQVINLGKAALGHLMSGMKEASLDLIQKRLDICKECEKYNPEKEKCSECGCYLSIKTSWDEQKCPLGKW